MSCELAHIGGACSECIGPAVGQSQRERVKMKRLIAGAIIVCVIIGLVAVAIIRHVNNKQDARWCRDHGYANYATKDRFCVGAGGKLVKIGAGGKLTKVRGDNTDF
jgi:hypothetical protein